MSLFQSESSPIKDFFNYLLEVIKVFLIALAIVVPVRYYLIQPFYVKGESMVPTFHDSEYLIIDEITYRFREPVRGEVIVFRYPQNPDQYYIKRIIGLPGETIKIIDGVITYTKPGGQPHVLDEVYLSDDVVTEGYNYPEVTLDDDEYFVMGDNRGKSYDSRQFGPLTKNFIIGRTMVRVLPVDSFTIFK